MVSAEPAEQGGSLFWGQWPCRKAWFSPVGELLRCKRCSCLSEERPCCLDKWSLSTSCASFKGKSSKWCLTRQGPSNTRQKDNFGHICFTRPLHWQIRCRTCRSWRWIPLLGYPITWAGSRPECLTQVWMIQSWHGPADSGTQTPPAGKSFWHRTSRSMWWVSLEAKVSQDQQELSFSFCYDRDSFRCSIENETIRRMPPGRLWVPQHSVCIVLSERGLGVKSCCCAGESIVLVMLIPPPASPGMWARASYSRHYAQCPWLALPCRELCPLPQESCVPGGSLTELWADRAAAVYTWASLGMDRAGRVNRLMKMSVVC